MRARSTLLLVVVALVAVACGSGDSGPGLATADDVVAGASSTGDDGTDTPVSEVDDAATEVDAEEALLDFAQCMRDEGVDMPDPEVDDDGNFRLNLRGLADESGIDREAMRVAREECSEHLEGVAQRFEGLDRTEIEDQLLAFAQCMRDNGYDMPDPDLSFTPGQGQGTPGEGGRVGPFGEIDPDDPAFIAAAEVCQTEFAFGGPGGLPGGGRPGGGG